MFPCIPHVFGSHLLLSSEEIGISPFPLFVYGFKSLPRHLSRLFSILLYDFLHQWDLIGMSLPRSSYLYRGRIREKGRGNRRRWRGLSFGGCLRFPVLSHVTTSDGGFPVISYVSFRPPCLCLWVRFTDGVFKLYSLFIMKISRILIWTTLWCKIDKNTKNGNETKIEEDIKKEVYTCFFSLFISFLSKGTFKSFTL